MSEKHILFVDDKQTEQISFRHALEAWNKKNPYRIFVPDCAATVDEARAKLNRHRFDCALFDLKLPSGNGPPGDGNELVKSGLEDFGIPVGVISGNVQDVDAGLRQVSMLEVFNKDEDEAYENAVAWLGGQWSMMEILAESRAEVRRSGAAMFPNRIWPNWANYEAVSGMNGAGLSRIVARQYAAQIAEHLGTEGAGGWHPFEHYISPAMLNDRAQTGDIFRLDNELWVLLTPACDLATKKAPVLLLAHCRSNILDDNDPLHSWAQAVADLSATGLNKDQRKARDTYFRGLINQNLPGKHFLPPLPNGTPMLVEFKQLKTMPRDELALRDRVASIAPAFLSNVVQRFGAYISRTGQPNIDFKHFA